MYSLPQLFKLVTWEPCLPNPTEPKHMGQDWGMPWYAMAAMVCPHRTVTLQRYGGLQDVLLTAMRAEQLDLGQTGQLGSPKLTKLTPSDAAS